MDPAALEDLPVLSAGIYFPNARISGLKVAQALVRPCKSETCFAAEALGT